MQTMTSPGDVLNRHMQRKGYNQVQFAALTGHDNTTVNKIIKDNRRPSIELFSEMTYYLGPVFALEYLEAMNDDEA